MGTRRASHKGRRARKSTAGEVESKAHSTGAEPAAEPAVETPAKPAAKPAVEAPAEPAAEPAAKPTGPAGIGASRAPEGYQAFGGEEGDPWVYGIKEDEGAEPSIMILYDPRDVDRAPYAVSPEEKGGVPYASILSVAQKGKSLWRPGMDGRMEKTTDAEEARGFLGEASAKLGKKVDAVVETPEAAPEVAPEAAPEAAPVPAAERPPEAATPEAIGPTIEPEDEEPLPAGFFADARLSVGGALSSAPQPLGRARDLAGAFEELSRTLRRPLTAHDLTVQEQLALRDDPQLWHDLLTQGVFTAGAYTPASIGLQSTPAALRQAATSPEYAHQSAPWTRVEHEDPIESLRLKAVEAGRTDQAEREAIRKQDRASEMPPISVAKANGVF